MRQPLGILRAELRLLHFQLIGFGAKHQIAGDLAVSKQTLVDAAIFRREFQRRIENPDLRARLQPSVVSLAHIALDASGQRDARRRFGFILRLRGHAVRR